MQTIFFRAIRYGRTRLIIFKDVQSDLSIGWVQMPLLIPFAGHKLIVLVLENCLRNP